MAGLDTDLVTDASIAKAIKFSNIYSDKREELLLKSPFHFNLIDEVGANENAHSKILGKLLRYKEQRKFVNLISLFDAVELDLKPVNPQITIETGRIDIAIFDDEYAIIIENKIHYAPDQDKQIARYVNKVKREGYGIEQIYVFYLTQWGLKKPDEKSLPTNLKKELGKRYFEINFRHDMLPWLENIFSRCRQKDKNLIHGLAQYIDYLKGMLKIRKKDKVMNDTLNELIKKELSLSENYKNNDGILKEKIEEFELCLTHMKSMRVGVRNNLRKEFLETLFSKLNEYESGWTPVTRIHQKATMADANSKFFGFSNKTYQFKNENLTFSVEVNKWERFYCGLYCDNKNLKERIMAAFEEDNVPLSTYKWNRNWLVLSIDHYIYDGSKKIGWNVYDDRWNNLYIKDMEGMVKIFFDQIVKVFEAWKKITVKKGAAPASEVQL